MKRVVTFGCRLNVYESEIIQNNLSQINDENIIVVNSCAVTNEAERQVGQAIRRIHRENPEKKIIVAGCAAQLNPTKYADMPGVYKVLGNEEKLKSESYSGSTKILVNNIDSVKEASVHLIKGFQDRVRAFVQVQNGCNHECTFCCITHARGPNRSIGIGEIVNQVRTLVANGYNEIVFTGVDITDFGADLPGKPNLAKLIKRLLMHVPELKRLRLSSVDVAEIDEELLDIIVHEQRLMPHIHISLQSGDNMILKRMKRRHNREQVIEFCNYIRSKRASVVFGADIITGFPTETREMFQNTIDLLTDTQLTYLHVFPFSAREGTPAARMPQLDKSIRKERARELIVIGKRYENDLYKSLIGKIQKVVVERNGYGRAENFALIKFNNNTEEVKVGEIVDLRVEELDSNRKILSGSVV